MKSTTALLLLAGATTLNATCTIQGFTTITFYGFPDNSPPGAGIAFDCGRGFVASSGDGSYDNPVTMATAPGEFNECETIYVPYLEKYVRFEDTCEQCTTDWETGIRHIDIWTGSPTVNGGQDQINCEDDLTQADESRTIVRNPATDYTVDSTALYVSGANPSCRTSHTYLNDNAMAHADCST